MRISSRAHPFVRRCRALAERRDGDAVLLDGEHLIADALTAGVTLEGVLTDGRGRGVVARARAAGVPILDATREVVDAASPVREPSGVVAIGRWKPAALDAMLNGHAGDAAFLVIGLAGVQDPGNVGTAIRSADALGAGGVVVMTGSADPGAWKTLRAAMGSTFRVPIAKAGNDAAMAAARASGLRVIAAAASADRSLSDFDFTAPAFVLLGAEGAGLSAALVRQADAAVRVPMRADVDSLNVGITASIIAYEARRQRDLRVRML